MKSTYDFLFDKRKELNPYDAYVKRIQTSNAPKAIACEIVGLRINSVMGTKYFGPEAVVTVSCKMTDGQTLLNRSEWIRQSDEWKIEE